MGAARSVRLDLLKALAIISVIFYHIGFQQYGYLGVDIFLVVGGYFLGRSLLKACENGTFSFFRFLLQRVLRLWPLLLIAATVSLLLGALFMLPDDYENLAQSVVATNFFANNILSAITTKNYWDVVNDFKPLMHTWYVGVLVQSYFVFAVFAKIATLFKRNQRRNLFVGFLVVSVVSLLVFLLPTIKAHEKFYYIPARIFELGLGALLAVIPSEAIKRYSRTFAKPVLLILQIALVASLILLITLPTEFLPADLRLLSVCVITGFLIFIISCDDRDWNIPIVKQLSFVGKASFSFFVWHQLIIAFFKYAWCAKFELLHILACIVLTCAVSIPSYVLLEGKLDVAMRKQTSKRICLAVFAVLCLVSTGFGLVINRNAGYVRDVPELGISKDNLSRGMHAAYCDRIYAYNKDFSEDSKTKILVIGNSFGRDFGNILLESKYSEEIDLSYAVTIEEAGDQRIRNADMIFYALSGNDFSTLPQSLANNSTATKIYIVGNKNFGDNNGNIYNRRHRDDYFESSITLTTDYLTQNDRLRRELGDTYIDLITPVQKVDGTIRVFTEDNKFISQDCRHLTIFGAQYYAKVLDLDAIFGR